MTHHEIRKVWFTCEICKLDYDGTAPLSTGGGLTFCEKCRHKEVEIDALIKKQLEEYHGGWD